MPRTQNKFAYIGIAAGSTWSELGELLSMRDDDEALGEWAERIKKDLHPEAAEYVTIAQLKKFAHTTYRILSKKFDGGSVAREAVDLLAPIKPGKVRDKGQFLDVTAGSGVWWAEEYSILFDTLSEPVEPDASDSWLQFATKCRLCGTFFVKQRKDQEFDGAQCRVNYHNGQSAPTVPLSGHGHRTRRRR